MLFTDPLEQLYDKFLFLTNASIKLREINTGEYITTGYIVPEINYSLKAEGVHSSRKMVDVVIKAKNSGDNFNKSKISKLFSNYCEALRFINWPLSEEGIVKITFFYLL